MENYDSLSTEEITKLNFPIKLWIMINNANDIIFWGKQGNTILINYPCLDENLINSLTIFNTKTLSNFLHQLKIYGFRKLTTSLASTSSTADMIAVKNSRKFNLSIEVHEFKNEYFQRNKPYLLESIKRQEFSRYELIHRYMNSDRSLRIIRKHNDPRYSSILSKISNLHKSRIKLRLTLELQFVTNLLNRKIIECEQNKVTHMILPAENYEEPAEQFLDVANSTIGYHGDNISNELVEGFYEEYLPKLDILIYDNVETVKISENSNTANNEKLINNQSDYMCSDKLNDQLISNTNLQTSIVDHNKFNNNVDSSSIGNNQFTAIHYEIDAETIIGDSEVVNIPNDNNFLPMDMFETNIQSKVINADMPDLNMEMDITTTIQTNHNDSIEFDQTTSIKNESDSLYDEMRQSYEILYN